MAARPRTLPAAVVPVLVGTALASRLAEWQAVPAFVCLVFALLIQIGTNFANDYFDCLKGADRPDRIGPTRVTAAGLVSARAMRRAIAGVFALAFLAGMNLVSYGGWWLVAVGVISILCGLAYTGGPFPLAYHSLGDVFVFVFFGLVAVAFTFYVQAGFFAWEVWVAGAAVGGLATNILVVNNLRDRETDARAGKITLAVRLGRTFMQNQFMGALLLAGAVPLVLYFRGYGTAILLPLLLAPVGYQLRSHLPRLASGPAFNSLLARTGLFLIGYGLLLSAGICFS